jgi:hypothetical protein
VFNAASGYTANGVDWTESAWGLLDKDVGASPLIPLYTEIGESAGGWRLFAKRETAELMIAHGASLITGSGLPGYFAYFLLLLLCGPRLA